MNDGKLLFTEYQSLYSSEKKKDESLLMQVNIFAGKERLCSSRPRQAAPPPLPLQSRARRGRPHRRTWGPRRAASGSA